MLTKAQMFEWMDQRLVELTSDRAEFVLRMYRNAYLAKDEVFEYIDSRGINVGTPAAQTYIGETKLERKNIVKASSLDTLFMDRTPMFRVKNEIDGTYGQRLDAEGLVGAIVLEEYGFVEIGDWLVGRTVQPWLLDQKFKMEPSLFVVPAIAVDQLFSSMPAMSSLAGGFAFSALFEAEALSAEFRTKYEVSAQVAMKATAFPESFGVYDQFTRAKLVTTEGSERVFENGD